MSINKTHATCYTSKAFAYTQKLRGFRKDAQERNLSLPTNFVRRSLLGVSKDAKTVKGESFGFLTGILYLSPLDLGGFGNVCPFASKGCAADCLTELLGVEPQNKSAFFLATLGWGVLNGGMNLSKRGIDFIIEQEATGEKYYTKRESRPNWPGESSGVTIGIGWDIGQNTKESLRQEWGQELWESHLERLEAVAGVTGVKAKPLCADLQDIDVPWASAIRVFNKFTIPRYWALTVKIYPQAEMIHPDAASALLSLVFNRGTRLTGETRTEMRAIQNALAENRLEAIPKLFKDQVRLWPDTEGLRDRRIAESDLFQSTLTA